MEGLGVPVLSVLDQEDRVAALHAPARFRQDADPVALGLTPVVTYEQWTRRGIKARLFEWLVMPLRDQL